MKIVCMFPENRDKGGLMQLEEAYAVNIMKLVEYVDRKEDPLIQIARTHKHNINSARLQTASCLKTAVQRGTRQTKESTAKRKQKKYGEGCMDNCHVT
jgi:hypothetical protein